MSDLDLDLGSRLAALATPPPWTYTDVIDRQHNVTQGGWDIASCSAGALDPDYGDRDRQGFHNARWVEWLGNNGAALIRAVRERDDRIRQLEADLAAAHCDAIVNRDTANRAHAAIDRVRSIVEVWGLTESRFLTMRRLGAVITAALYAGEG